MVISSHMDPMYIETPYNNQLTNHPRIAPKKIEIASYKKH